MLKIENDKECLYLLQKGNTKALEYLIKIYFPLLCDYAERILENRAEAEDIAEESFIKLWERRLSFDTFNELKSYL